MAPAVLAAYTLPSGWVLLRLSKRSMAGSVAPMAKVAGNKANSGMKKARAQCQSAEGSAPIHWDSRGKTWGDANATNSAQLAIKASKPAYQRPG